MAFVAPAYRKNRLLSVLPSLEKTKKRTRGEHRTAKMKYWSQPKIIARLTSSPSTPSASSSSSCSSSSSSSSSSVTPPRRPKIKWTAAEVKLLREEVSDEDYQNGNVSWAVVAKKFEIRTGADCRDKMRNLMKSKKRLKF